MPKKIANAEVKMLKAWLKKNSGEIEWDDRNQTPKLLLKMFRDCAKEPDLALAWIRLKSNAGVWILRGAVAALEGDSEAWRYYSIYGQYWQAILSCDWFDHERGLKGHPGIDGEYTEYQVSRVLAVWTVLGWKAQAKWLALWMEDDVRRSRRRKPFPFEFFMCALVRVWHGEPAAGFANRPDFGVYSPIFAAWENEEELVKALKKACDYHIKQSDGPVDSVRAFDEVPITCWPCEIVAIWKVRSSMGLPMPSFSHPLIDDNPLYQLPPGDVPPAYDAVLDIVDELLMPRSFLDKLVGGAAATPTRKMPSPRKAEEPMSIEQFEALLLAGDRKSMQDAVVSPFAVCVEHANVPEDLLEQVREVVGHEGTAYRLQFKVSKSKVAITFGGETTTLAMGGQKAPFAAMMTALADILAAEHTIMGFRNSIGVDTMFYAMLPPEWFKSFKKRHAKRCKEVFAECSEMT